MIESATVTTLMKTLADPTRRAVYERILQNGEATVGELVKRSHVSQPAISQHVRALRDAGLVSEERKGRQVFYRPLPEGLAPLVDWIAHYGQFWRERFDRIETLLKEMDQ
jgi:DNA-binding transcriptional ArsR family regulator